MKTFILAMRDLKIRPQTLNCKLCWNPKKMPWQKSQWLVTTTFSENMINKMGLEFVYKPILIVK
jgi:hypothetical protein